MTDSQPRPGKPDPAVEAERAARRRVADRVSVRGDGGSADVLGSLLRETDR